MRFLVVGCGRAGVRHIKTLRNVFPGCKIVGLDIDRNRGQTARAAGADGFYYYTPAHLYGPGDAFDGTIIATTPDSHLSTLQWRKDAGDRAFLMEKPLCGWDQLDLIPDCAGVPVMMAFNWRWHPVIKSLHDEGFVWGMQITSRMWRETFPTWGVVLDHFPHSLDIARYLLSEELAVKESWIRSQNGVDLVASAHGTGFWIYESAVYPGDRRTDLMIVDHAGKHSRYELVPDDAMFERMISDFISVCRGEIAPPTTLLDGVVVQQLLQEVREKAYSKVEVENERWPNKTNVPYGSPI